MTWNIMHKSGTVLFTTKDKFIALNRAQHGWRVEEMNDITALAQKIKASAIAVARDGRTDDEWFYYLQCVHHKNVLALVEALEKAQNKATLEPVALRWRWNDYDAQWTYAPASKMPDFVAAGFSPENGVVIESLYTAPPAMESRTATVKWPTAKDASQGWKIDPEFICKVQGAIGYDEEEGTPSMEVVEAVLLAAAGIQVIEGEG